MKSTGIIRRVDDLGRVVIPKEIRRKIGAAEGDPMEIFVKGNQVILEKYEVGCVFCGDHGSGVIEFKDKYVCRDCLGQINNKE